MKDIRIIPDEAAAGRGPLEPDKKNRILYFIMENRLFGHEAVPEEGTLMVSEEAFCDLAQRSLTFISHSGDDIPVKIFALKKIIWAALPVTSQRLDVFFIEHTVPRSTQYRLLDWAAAYLKSEAHLMDSGEAAGIIRQMNCITSLDAVRTFCFFLEWMRVTYHDTRYSVAIIPPASRSRSTAGQAYGIGVMAALYYYLFNEEAIRQQDLITRACTNEVSANAWTYLSIHLVSALRDTDLARITHPSLPEAPEEVLMKVKADSYDDGVYRSAVHSTMKRLGYIHMQPNKTHAGSGIPELVLVIPQSLEVHFGRLFLICEAHRRLSGKPDDGPLFKKVTDYNRLRSCLGENIGSIFKERNASPVGLAKSYLQCLEAGCASSSADKRHSAVHGYMLASMARSHKNGPEGFAETTAAYLKDFGLGIISPEQTAREMFDRGILSCLPSMLLDLITDGVYKNLDFSQQADMLSELGLSPLEVENLMEMILIARERSQAALKEAMSWYKPEERQPAAAKALARIAGYQAPGKQPDILCLMSAMGKTCQDPASSNCLLCPFRIDTRAAVYQAAGELRRLNRLAKQAVTAGEKKKYRLLALHCLLPALQISDDIIRQAYGPSTSEPLMELLREIVGRGMYDGTKPGTSAETIDNSYSREDVNGYTIS